MTAMAAVRLLVLFLLGTLTAGVVVGPIPDFHAEPELPDLDVPATHRLDSEEATVAAHSELSAARGAVREGRSYNTEDADPPLDHTEREAETETEAETEEHNVEQSASRQDAEPVRAARRLILTPDAARGGSQLPLHTPAPVRFSSTPGHAHPVHPSASRMPCWGLAARCCYREMDAGFLCVDDYAERAVRCTPRLIARVACDGGGPPDPGAPPRPPVRLREDEAVTRLFAEGNQMWDDDTMPATGASGVYFAPTLPRAPKAPDNDVEE